MPWGLAAIAALALPACQAMVDVDAYTFGPTPLDSSGAADMPDAGGGAGGGRLSGVGAASGAAGVGGAAGVSGAAGAGGAGGRTGDVGGAGGAPPAQGGSAGSSDPLLDPQPPSGAQPGETPLAAVVAALESLPRATDGFLREGEVLVVGEPLRSRNDHVELRLDPDGLSVTHQRVNEVREVVATIPLTNAHVATLGDDGHFVIFARDGSVTDVSSAAGAVTGPTLRVQNDGNVVLYDNYALLPRSPRWTTNTNVRRSGVCRRLDASELVYPVEIQPLTSCNGFFRLVMDVEGRLVVVDPLNFLTFVSPSGGGPEAIAIMQRDGNLVVYDVDDVPVWATNTDYAPGAYAAVEDDGTLAVFGPDDVQIWPPPF